MTERNGQADTALAYDLQGRPQARQQYHPTASGGYESVTSSQFYDGAGRPSQLTYPSGRSVTTEYDAQGQVSRISTQPASGYPVSLLAGNFNYGYPFAGPFSFSYGNGQTYTQSRDLDYRPLDSSDGPRSKFVSFDQAGNMASQQDSNNTLLTYGYDATGRLVSALDSASGSFGSLGWTYDKNGNRLTETRNASTTPYTYNPLGSNWLSRQGTDTRSKTASGNTVSISGVASFTYDGFNRLASSTSGKDTTTYTYNALGARIKKEQKRLSTVFHYGQDGELLYEKDQAGNTKEYVWINGRPLARIDNGTAIYTYHVDHLGTPQAMTNSTGAVVWKADYEPFGKATVKVSTLENNLRLPGQYFDRETGLHYNYFRDYEPGTGRYVEADPIGLEGGMNLYAYVEGNPVGRIDPYGLKFSIPPSKLPPEGGPTSKTCLKKGEQCHQRAQRGILECMTKRGLGVGAYTCKEEWNTWMVNCSVEGAKNCDDDKNACDLPISNEQGG